MLTLDSGSKTGQLFPTGNITDILDGVTVTCIDAGNPCVFVEAQSLDVDGTMLPDSIDNHPTLLAKLDSIRRKASVTMGISKEEVSCPGSIPKIAIVSKSKPHQLLSGVQIEESQVDLVVRALSVGQPHRAVPITVVSVFQNTGVRFTLWLTEVLTLGYGSCCRRKHRGFGCV